MSHWRSFVGDAAAWDAALARLSGANFYQCHAWGEVKQRLGWRALRLACATADGAVTALAQILIRTYPFGVAVAWLPGGVAGQAQHWSADLPGAIVRAAGARWIYLRMNALYAFEPGQAAILTGDGWRRPTAHLTTGLSLRHNLGTEEESRLKGASGNWRHNLKRSARHTLTVSVWDGADAASVHSVYQAMEAHKNLPPQSRAMELAAGLALPAERMILMRCTDSAGATLALRACALFGDTAWDLLAAATPAARKVYASHATLWALLKACAARGVKTYDLGGIDPEGNKGVFDFKQGLGAPRIEYLGEWEWASNPLLRLAANMAIRRRGGRL